MAFDEVTIGNCRLIHGDCREVLPLLPRADAIVTDPPYGLGDKLKGGKANTKGKWKLTDGGDEMGWDDEAPAETVLALLGMADAAIIWGGNYFQLPPSRGWLLWDKIVREFSSGHAEMAWTTIDQPVRAFNFAHAQLAREGKVHPTQKPVALMTWCLSFLPKSKTILDPYMGSGTTGVACINLDKHFIGIDRERKYFEIACERIARAQAQGQLLPPEPVAAPEQQTMELMTANDQVDT